MNSIDLGKNNKQEKKKKWHAPGILELDFSETRAKDTNAEDAYGPGTDKLGS